MSQHDPNQDRNDQHGRQANEGLFPFHPIHLHQFRIHGKHYGIAPTGGIWFSDDPDSVKLIDLGLRINERFFYEYDFTDN
jgi:hypothetical protein